MATQEVVKTLWKNWCALTPENRERVAGHLGAVGKLLSIAANVQSIAVPKENEPENADQNKSTNGSKATQNDDDIIDVEFEEV